MLFAPWLPSTLLAPAELLPPVPPRSLPAELLPSHSSPKAVPLSSIALSQVQYPTLSCLEDHAVDDCPMLQYIHIPLRGRSSLQGVGSTFHFSVSKLGADAINSCIQITDEDVEQNWPWN